MKNCTLKLGLIALVMALGAAPACAQDKPAAGHPASAKSAKKQTKPARPAKAVDINSASKADLRKLPGIGDAVADRIIAGRPYVSKADLVTRKVVPTGVYVQIRRRIVTLPKPEPAAKAAEKQR